MRVYVSVCVYIYIYICMGDLRRWRVPTNGLARGHEAERVVLLLVHEQLRRGRVLRPVLPPSSVRSGAVHHQRPRLGRRRRTNRLRADTPLLHQVRGILDQALVQVQVLLIGLMLLGAPPGRASPARRLGSRGPQRHLRRILFAMCYVVIS